MTDLVAEFIEKGICRHSFNNTDISVAEAVYMALGYLECSVSSRVLQNRMRHASLRYTEHPLGFECQVKLPGVTAKVVFTKEASGKLKKILYVSGLSYMCEDWNPTQVPGILIFDQRLPEYGNVQLEYLYNEILVGRQYLLTTMFIQVFGLSIGYSVAENVLNYPVLTATHEGVVLRYYPCHFQSVPEDFTYAELVFSLGLGYTSGKLVFSKKRHTFIQTHEGLSNMIVEHFI